MNSFKSLGENRVRLDTSLEMLLERGPQAPVEFALATVVATAGSTYRKPGARMFIMADGGHLGLLSGGCLEADLKLHAQQVIASGHPRAVEYDMRGPDDFLFGLGAGCEGAMRVLIEPASAAGSAASALSEAGRITATGSPACLVAVHESTEVALGTYHPEALPSLLRAAAEASLREGCSREVVSTRGAHRMRAFVQFLAPPPHLLICGAGPDAQPVVAASRAMGWRVTIVDHRPAYADSQKFPGARVVLGNPRALSDAVDLEHCHAVVVMSHHLASDVEYLKVLSRTDVPAYVGLLGPEARRRKIAAELGELSDGLRSRLRGPVGIDIGAMTPEAIAIAIVGQVHAWLANRPSGATATTG